MLKAGVAVIPLLLPPTADSAASPALDWLPGDAAAAALSVAVVVVVAVAADVFCHF
jgi:hypothetical protein